MGTLIDEAAVTKRLIADEGEVLHAYQDHLGFWTLGVGRLIDERKGGGISPDESRYLLRNDIARKSAECEQRFEWWGRTDSIRQAAIVCMAFQLGTPGLSNFKKMMAAMSVADYETASVEMLDSTWAKQTAARANRMARIIRTGEWE